METLLEVRNLSKTYRYRTGLFRRQHVEAVKNVSFTLREKQTLAIIGENGSGKSTLAKMLSGMVAPSEGEMLIDDHPLSYGDYGYRSQRIRMIFQDPSTSLNPRQRVSQILDFPLRLNTDLDDEAREKRIIATLHQVGLAARPRRLLSAHAGTRTEAASGAGARADSAAEGDCRR
ncbi:peptide transport system ATP-binding protein sapF [Plautia stali symbiont]|nr:peptide transport system ATP-binding protein sapF [Plautia stali symbiont]